MGVIKRDRKKKSQLRDRDSKSTPNFHLRYLSLHEINPKLRQGAERRKGFTKTGDGQLEASLQRNSS